MTPLEEGHKVEINAKRNQRQIKSESVYTNESQLFGIFLKLCFSNKNFHFFTNTFLSTGISGTDLLSYEKVIYSELLILVSFCYLFYRPILRVSGRCDCNVLRNNNCESAFIEWIYSIKEPEDEGNPIEAFVTGQGSFVHNCPNWSVCNTVSKTLIHFGVNFRFYVPAP